MRSDELLLFDLAVPQLRGVFPLDWSSSSSGIPLGESVFVAFLAAAGASIAGGSVASGAGGGQGPTKSLGGGVREARRLSTKTDHTRTTLTTLTTTL